MSSGSCDAGHGKKGLSELHHGFVKLGLKLANGSLPLGIPSPTPQSSDLGLLFGSGCSFAHLNPFRWRQNDELEAMYFESCSFHVLSQNAQFLRPQNSGWRPFLCGFHLTWNVHAPDNWGIYLTLIVSNGKPKINQQVKTKQRLRHGSFRR